ncbi:B3/B4 domain-containing protein [Erwinia sorbitola]|uniref:B3/B4 tRNA-binding domain-containing protein n=1 Tax=Erwinia sorbitola TaxID=2681984 RepID=A0A6I6EQN8_9GAMM|nr:B3/4 domain-containing protein [Erwinia sorbitola]QGU86912.1 hypothetical protein GN242_06670 [Erwinia sorbitola]
MLTVRPSIDPAITAIAPQFRALSIVVEAAPIANAAIGQEALRAACLAVSPETPAWAEAHLAAWSEVFKSFGAKPKRTPCSAEALRKRVLRDGTMPAIDPVVDLYNAISIKYAIPVGGENIAAYKGEPRLTVAEGTELFDTVKEGEVVDESVDPGEVIWRDDKGVTCRRWNWRQGVRTRLDSTASQMWFILESLPAMPEEALYAAGDELIEGLQRMMPGAKIEKQLLSIA